MNASVYIYVYSIGRMTIDRGNPSTQRKIYSSITLSSTSPTRMAAARLKILGSEYMNVFVLKIGSDGRIL
jgi:hypothetical protein